MPIPKHLRHFYRGKQYDAWRARLVKRSGNKCEQCRKPNGLSILTVTPLNILGLRMAWTPSGLPNLWRDQNGKPVRRLTHWHVLKSLAPGARAITVVLTAAHLNHTPGDDRDENGKMLCQWCHLHHDQHEHLKHAKETRLNRKDAARPLLQEGVCA